MDIDVKDRQILLQFQYAKRRKDAAELYGLDDAEIYQEYFEALDDLSSLQNPELRAFAAEACVETDGTIPISEIELRKFKAENQLLNISYEFGDYFPCASKKVH